MVGYDEEDVPPTLYVEDTVATVAPAESARTGGECLRGRQVCARCQPTVAYTSKRAAASCSLICFFGARGAAEPPVRLDFRPWKIDWRARFMAIVTR